MSKNSPQNTNNYIGLMSGTSLDGIDVVAVNFDGLQPQLIAAHTLSIPLSLRERIIETIQPDWTGTLSEIGRLHQELGKLFADASITLLQKYKLEKNTIKAIGSHGQTLWHEPNGKLPFSMQLGDANLIAEKTGITTVADFRSRDIAAGGQGAPLVSAFHKALFTHTEKNRIILNIGGIANITVLPSTNHDLAIQGYDTGPGNGLIDAWIAKHFNHQYDKNGDWGRSGKIIPSILNRLLSDPYFNQKPPKSTGKETFNLVWVENHLNAELINNKPENIQATLTELTARTITDNITNCNELFVCGGGIYNKFLLERLQHHLPLVEIDSTKVLGVEPDWMEAMAFAWMAKQTVEEKPSNLPSVTGSKGDRILGAIYPS